MHNAFQHNMYQNNANMNSNTQNNNFSTGMGAQNNFAPMKHDPIPNSTNAAFGYQPFGMAPTKQETVPSTNTNFGYQGNGNYSWVPSK